MSEDYKIVTCKICNGEVDTESYGVNLFHVRNGVCDECARNMALSYWYRTRRQYHRDFCTAEELDYLAAQAAAITPEPRRKAVISYKLRIQVFERDRYRCQTCGSHEKLRIDHVIPESRGGATVFENLQTLCHGCNTEKGAKMPMGGAQ